MGFEPGTREPRLDATTRKPLRPLPKIVKTTVDLPSGLWRQAKIAALDAGTDLRQIVIAALETFLSKTKGDAR
jgi:hypothetical protein